MLNRIKALANAFDGEGKNLGPATRLEIAAILKWLLIIEKSIKDDEWTRITVEDIKYSELECCASMMMDEIKDEIENLENDKAIEELVVSSQSKPN